MKAKSIFVNILHLPHDILHNDRLYIRCKYTHTLNFVDAKRNSLLHWKHINTHNFDYRGIWSKLAVSE